MERIFLEAPIPLEEMGKEVERTISAHGESHGSNGEVAIRLVVTRGTGPIGLDVSHCRQPRFLVYVFPARVIPEEALREGIAVVISQVRRNHPSALDPRIKSGNFLNNILAYEDARKAGAQEAILLDASGNVAEGTTSNVFTVSGGVIRTPRAFGILDGITRGVVIEEVRGGGLEIREEEIPPASLLGADEVFITSSGRGILPVSSADGRRIGASTPGPITRRLLELYEERVARECGGPR